MKTIELTQGKVALVDDSDFERLNQFKWYVYKGLNTFYAARNIPFNGKQKRVRMHNVIMGGMGIDHRDGNGLNNQKNNLRFCTQSQNIGNCRKQENTSSVYKGVCWHKLSGKWMAYININGKRINLGLFVDEVEAAKAYNAKAIELFTEFANLNTFKDL